MTAREIRERFLKYFKGKNHNIVKSSSLIPKDDPTLLFTNAGMVQFKEIFLGTEKSDYQRAASSQKCVRAGGKHNDLENVGKTARHHTFFEMLGNFSFGDYFKEGAIEMGWEFLTREMKLPADKLWVTIFEDDDESFLIWQNKIGVPEEKIVRLGEQDNYWSMGDIGPCGPCSEILIDQGEELGCKKPSCRAGCDCDRYLELWNLVFMQFNRDARGNLTSLPKPSIDTGLGLERIAAVLQGVRNNFDSDLFSEIIRYIENLSSVKYREGDKSDVAIRVIADHIRAITFLIGDGVLPANEGRGYVLRRIMRRAARYGKNLGLNDPFLFKISKVVVDTMNDAYPELSEGENFIARVIESEEKRFLETLDRGLAILNEEIIKLLKQNQTRAPGELVFKLYDTFGFPPDLTRDILREEGLDDDQEGFSRAMEEQKERARTAWKGSGEEGIQDIYKEIINTEISTDFCGYHELKTSARILKIIKEKKVISSADLGDEVEIISDKTPFYGESGGQVGDRGVIRGKDFLIEINDSQKPAAGLIVHQGKVKEGKVKEGEEISLLVNAELRQDIVINHTATHLLHAALKEVMGDHIKQAGSLVSPQRLRFDFTHFAAIKREDLDRVEAIANAKIRKNIPVATSLMGIDQALDDGATALFGEKYGKEVRVVTIGDFSKELCGGTHAKYTGEIGLFKILSEGGIAAGVRRIEALTGAWALKYIKNNEDILNNTGGILKSIPNEVYDKVAKLLENQKKLEKEIDSIRNKLAGDQAKDLFDQAREIKGVKVLSARVDLDDPKALRNFVDDLKSKIKSGIIVLGATGKDKVSLIVGVTKNLTKRFNAGKIIKEVAGIVGGSGGGRPDMAQAGGSNPEKLKEALEKVYQIVEEEKGGEN